MLTVKTSRFIQLSLTFLFIFVSIKNHAQCVTCTGGTSNFTWFNGTSGAQWSINTPARNASTTNVYTFNGPSGPATVSVSIADLPSPNGSMVVNADECAALSSVGGIFNQFFTGTTGQATPGACTPNTNTGPGYLQVARTSAINSGVPANSVFRVTFKFSTPAYVSNFRIVDIDYFGSGTPEATSTSNYQDRVRVRAHRSAAAVNLFAVNSNVGGTSIVSVTGNNSTQVTGTSIYAAADGNEIDPGDVNDQRTWMILNSGCNLVDSITIDYDNNRPNNNLLQMIALGGFDFCYKTVNVSGNIFNDSDGIADGFNGEAKIAALGSSPLYAYLVGPTGNVVSAPVQVASDGTYLFTNVTSSSYTVALSTVRNVAIGAAPPAPNFPAGWVSTGEINGTGTVNDGTANARSAAVAVDAAGANVVNINFGLQRIPVSPNQAYTIATPAPFTTRILNGTGAGNSPGPLTGTDAEDGNLGSGRSFRITSISGLNGSRLFYNGIQITGPITISNYNPSLLTMQFSGINSTSASFGYASIDAAGFQSNAATYTVSWLTVLPVNRLELSAEKHNGVVTLNWITEDEDNSSRFYIEQSFDGAAFDKIGTTAAAGKTTGLSTYIFTTDVTAITKPAVYYRIKLTDADGKITLSNIVSVRLNEQPSVQVWPNPFMEQISVSFKSRIASAVTVLLFNRDGKLMQSKQQMVLPGSNVLVLNNLQQFPAGIYVLKIKNSNGTINYVTDLLK